MELENELTRVLRRESPPDGFADRVLAQIERDEQQASARHHRRPVWWRAAAASVTLTALIGAWATHSYVQYRRAVYAKEQVLTALRIAGEKVRYAQQEVRQIGN